MIVRGLGCLSKRFGCNFGLLVAVICQNFIKNIYLVHAIKANNTLIYPHIDRLGHIAQYQQHQGWYIANLNSFLDEC